MAFSFTYKEIFNRAAFSRTWLESSRRDKALRRAVVFGFLLAFGLAAFLAGDFPPNRKLVAPFLYIGNFELLPWVALFPVTFYLCAWVADDFPIGSRQAIVSIGLLGIVIYPVGAAIVGADHLLARTPFVLYAVAIVALASLQTARIKSELV